MKARFTFQELMMFTSITVTFVHKFPVSDHSLLMKFVVHEFISLINSVVDFKDTFMHCNS